MSAALFTPGTTPWLVRHELRLAWRGVGGKRLLLTLILLIALELALHAGAWAVLSHLPSGPLPPFVVPLLGGTAWLAISLMLSQAIVQSVSALFDRGDLDLLLASPLPTRSVFMARGLGIAASVAGLYLVLLAPLANVGLFTGHATLLAIYPALMALALGVTALGMLLTLGLVRLLGARRARTVAQLLGALVGALLFLGSQAGHLVNGGTKRALALRLAGWIEPGGLLAPDSALWFPARALLGDLLPLAAVLLVGAGGFWLVIGLTHGRFLAGTQETVSGSARRGAVAASGRQRFRAGLGHVVLLKEWRLILRDPQLITQTLLQLLYLMPLIFVALRGESRGQALLAPGAVWLASSLAGNLAWITMAAEDAPELLGTSPNARRRLLWLKLLAAVLPVWLIVSPLPLFLLGSAPWQAVVFVLCVAGGTLCTGFVQIAYPRQGKRGDLKSRGKGHVGLTLLELLITVGWAGTAYALLARPLYAPLPLLLALAGLGAVWWLGRGQREA